MPRLHRCGPTPFALLLTLWVAAPCSYGQDTSTLPPSLQDREISLSLPKVAKSEDAYRYVYPEEDLGATYSANATRLKLWAPSAKSVRVLLFAGPTGPPLSSIEMAADSHGVWSAKLDGDRHGQHYLYELTHVDADSGRSMTFRVNDPYARGCSRNSGRTLIYDPARTNPPDWDRDAFVELRHNTDAVIYELHVRDFTIASSSGVASEHRGKYLGLIESGTMNPDGESTGLDHLVEMGVTHVHLLPVQDYPFGDETETAETYSWYDWGYGTMLFNTPEGSYASDPDGTVRQREFKQMVQALHRKNIGVVLDVVYNHTAATGTARESVFDKVFPHYFYRHDAAGNYTSASGCGNDVASQRPMARKFIVDSVKYWMTEYHVDGFRFDLMGLIDRETMLAVYREAKRINPNAIIYGEGWDMERLLPAEQMMTQARVRGTGIAAFNDGIRDTVKGEIWNDETPGFVQGAGYRRGKATFLLNIMGQSTGDGIEVDSPIETVNYVSSHDDHCLWDKLCLSTPQVPESLRIQMDKLAIGIVLTSQGIPFLHAGDEFLRSKNLVKNSYNSNDPNVNPIDWQRKSKYRGVVDYCRGLIQLRKSHPAFRMTDRATVDRSIRFLKTAPKHVVAFTLGEHANGDDWQRILVVYNGNREAKKVRVAGTWHVVANAEHAGVESLGAVSDEILVAPCSLVVAYIDPDGEQNAR